MKREEVAEILNERKKMKLRIIIQSIIIGVGVGFLIVINRIMAHNFFNGFKKLYVKASENVVYSLGLILFIALVGLVVGFMVKKEPMISGSGMPQVKGRVINKIK